MGQHSTRFPLEIAFGSSGGPGFNTAISERFQRPGDAIPRWSEPRWTWDVSEGLKDQDDAYALHAFYNARQGPANQFRFFDFQDHTTAANGRDDPDEADVLIGTGDGTTTQFQLFKVYAEGGETRRRTILAPIHGETLTFPDGSTKSYNVLVSVAGSTVLESGNWSVDTTTGILTFTTAPALTEAVRVGFAFDSWARFGIDLDAAFRARHEASDVMSLDNIPVEEWKGSVAHYEEINYGGSKSWGTVTANFTVTTVHGKVHLWTDNTGVNCILPDLADIPTTGGEWFVLVNLSGSATTNVVEADGSTSVVMLAGGAKAKLYVGKDSMGAKIWIATS